MKIHNYTVVIAPDEDGGFVVTCPALPGLVTEGDSLDEAREMVAEAILGYLESLKLDGMIAPPDVAVVVEPVSVRVA